jgi:hypothetical protein
MMPSNANLESKKKLTGHFSIPTRNLPLIKQSRALFQFSQFLSMSITLFVLTIALLCFSQISFAQTDTSLAHTETIRGTVYDAGSHLPLPFARIAVIGTGKGAIANADGQFRINVKVGHYYIKAMANGYSSATQEVNVGSAHQSVIDFELKELISKGDTIVITGANALDPVNTNASVSITPFSIQDVNRYAAAFQDPSRMAENFAGVFGRGTTNNYITVRGGSPIELLWRLDGIDIPNPNHFGKNGSTGGLVSAINSDMLGNSDFLTGAFTSQYGTKMSAVFDLHTRNGNAEKYEGTAQLSLAGTELMLEGGIPTAEGSSFLLGYRYSTIRLIQDVGLLNFSTIPNFNDAMGKLHFKFGGFDQINFTGLWGKASIDLSNTKNDELGSGSGILVAGLDWQHIFSENFITHFLINHVENSFDEGLGILRTENTKLTYNTIKAIANYSPTLDHNFEVGLTAQKVKFYTNQLQGYNIEFTQETNLYQAHLNWNWHIIPQLVLNSGIYTQFIEYDSSSSFEPRVSLSYSPTEEHTFAFAFGVHRQPEPIQFTQSLHYVAGYTLRPSPDVLIKIEGYEKDYSHAPIHASISDSYSFLNEGFAERIDFNNLVNKGNGKAYGAELTLMKHYDNGYYLTFTGSYVRQQFAGSDNIWRWGAFDNIVIFNFLSGFDIPVGRNSVLTLSEKFTVAGGGAYTPFDLQRSSQTGYGILDSNNAFGARNPPYVRLDINAEYHINWRSSALIIYASIINALGIDNVVDRRFSSMYDGTPYIEEYYDLPFLPILGVKFEF